MKTQHRNSDQRMSPATVRLAEQMATISILSHVFFAPGRTISIDAQVVQPFEPPDSSDPPPRNPIPFPGPAWWKLAGERQRGGPLMNI